MLMVECNIMIKEEVVMQIKFIQQWWYVEYGYAGSGMLRDHQRHVNYGYSDIGATIMEVVVSAWRGI